MFEEAVQVGGVCEAEAVGDVAHAPVGVMQQLGFAGETLGNEGVVGLPVTSVPRLSAACKRDEPGQLVPQLSELFDLAWQPVPAARQPVSLVVCPGASA